jgi:dolichol-phosphate mannosyltransferase
MLESCANDGAMSHCKVAVIIPCYYVAEKLENVINTLPDFVNCVIVVDDKCPQNSWQIAHRAQSENPKISVVRHVENQGVGGAMVSGYKAALQTDCQVFVKMDGDGQMNPEELPRLIAPLLDGSADYAKGNRFRDFRALEKMPKVRLFGNSILSFLLKAASGYWNIMDPTNGYTAIHRGTLEKLDLDKISRRFFFESDMLIQLNVVSAVVRDVPMKAQYGDERSSLDIGKVLLQFPFKLARGLMRRIFLKYFVYDFNMASVYMMIGIPLLIFGVTFGVWEWIGSWLTGKTKSAGTIMVAALPIIIALQMLLQAIQIDIDKTPRNRS